MATVEWCIGEELVAFREDPSSRLNADKFHNIINGKNYSQPALRLENL